MTTSSIFLLTPRYLSVAELKASSKSTTLLALTDTEIQILIVKAESEVDKYLWYSFTYFPYLDERSLCILSELDQLDIKQSVMYITESLQKKWISVNNTLPWIITSESDGDRSISYKVSNTSNNITTVIPDIAINILKQYKQIFLSQEI